MATDPSTPNNMGRYFLIASILCGLAGVLSLFRGAIVMGVTYIALCNLLLILGRKRAKAAQPAKDVADH